MLLGIGFDTGIVAWQAEQCGRSFFDFDDIRDRRGSMSGKGQPYIHKYIADTIFDLQVDEAWTGRRLFTLFMMLKTTADVVHHASLPFARSAGGAFAVLPAALKDVHYWQARLGSRPSDFIDPFIRS